MEKKNPPADFKPVQHVLLVFLDATGRRGLGFAFLPSYDFERMGTRSGLQYSQFSGLWPSSSMSCQAQINHLAAHSMRQAGQSGSTLSHSVSGCSAAEITLGVRQLLLESSLKSSCPPFLTSTGLFTQPNFPTRLETI